MQLSLLRAAAAAVRRSCHFVPGNNRKFLDKALTLRPDTVILDLEDSVPTSEKATGRETVRSWLNEKSLWPAGGPEICVRINPLGTAHWREDVEAVLKGTAVPAQTLMVPKVSHGDDLVKLGEIVAEVERSASIEVGSTKFIPIASEVPEAVFNLKSIASAPRVAAMTWGCEDLSAEIMATKTKNKDKTYLDVFRLVRSMTLLAAKAANVQAIDGVFTDLNDAKGLAEESADGRDTGFDGKLSIHPNQIAVINKVFTPTWKELQEASKLIAAFEQNAGKGALRFKGQMVDEPHVKRAKALLARGKTLRGLLPPAKPDADTTRLASSDNIVRHGRWFDELPEGLIIKHALTRTVTETDNILFTTMSMNPAALHLDYAQAAETEFGRPLVNSMFTVALVVGISVLESTHGTTIANLGFDQVLFPKPLFYGDTIRVETEVISARASKSRPTQGIVTFEHRAYNQAGDLVCKARRNALMKKSPTANLK
mmetsp:Transcript_56159/g.89092  ORF Transcript_56159/g.89092 Transcript_56159/m.89092 type:complete len:484 (+) Transcript_56159:62-1513(+)